MLCFYFSVYIGNWLKIEIRLFFAVTFNFFFYTPIFNSFILWGIFIMGTLKIEIFKWVVLLGAGNLLRGSSCWGFIIGRWSGFQESAGI